MSPAVRQNRESGGREINSGSLRLSFVDLTSEMPEFAASYFIGTEW